MLNGPQNGDEVSGVPSSDSASAISMDVKSLRVTRHEARQVLDHQLTILSDIDDKAMRTVRITLLSLALLFSTSTVAPRTAFLNWITILGAGALSVAVIFGLATYSSSNPELGIGRQYLRDVQTHSYDEASWQTVLLAGYAEWIGDMEELNQSNALTLTIAQFFLGSGIVLILVGVFLGMAGVAGPAEVTVTSATSW